jgi:hypothetical protein
MVAIIRVIATVAFAYVLFAGYLLFTGSPARGVTGTVGFFLSAVAGWLLAFFGDEVAEFFDLPPVNTLLRGGGVLLLIILAVVAFTQSQA